MNKPIKPEITIPQSFAENGVKTDFDDTLLADGFDNLRPDVLAGDNLNKFIDDTYKGLNYGMAAADALNLINEGETLIVKNGEFTSGAAGGGGLEIGDIGIAPLGIDETQGKRRYLNGQLIIQEQYVEFTNKVKSAVALYPSLVCTEEEWQTTATMTVGGQVGKFVVDDEGGTIRLPKIIMPIQGLTDLTKLGEIVEAGLPNIEGQLKVLLSTTTQGQNGAFSTSLTGANKNALSNGSYYSESTVNFNASLSNPIYGNSDTVQQEQIQYPYFIQVATGAETEDNIINEIELNNPFSLLDYKYSEYELNNISWLRSNGQYNSKAVYPAVYDLLLKIYNGAETKAGVSVKLWTETFTDYDFVLNTAEETFRLPLLDGSENIVDYNNGQTIATDFIAPCNGLIIAFNKSLSGSSATAARLYVNGVKVGIASGGTTIQDATSMYALVKQGDVVTFTNMNIVSFFKSTGNGSLYFYVGETVQNANLINAGRIEEKIATLIPDNSNLIASYAFPSKRYIDLTLGASDSSYTAPAKGWYFWEGLATSATNPFFVFRINSNEPGTAYYSAQNNAYKQGSTLPIMIQVNKGDVVYATYNNITTSSFRFIYAEGEQ